MATLGCIPARSINLDLECCNYVFIPILRPRGAGYCAAMDVHHYRMMAVLCRTESVRRQADRAAADTWSRIAREYEQLAQGVERRSDVLERGLMGAPRS
jgi:hypothetical protein